MHERRLYLMSGEPASENEFSHLHKEKNHVLVLIWVHMRADLVGVASRARVNLDIHAQESRSIHPTWGNCFFHIGHSTSQHYLRTSIRDQVLLIVAMNKPTNIWTLTSANFQFSNELHEATSITKQQEAKNWQYVLQCRGHEWWVLRRV